MGHLLDSEFLVGRDLSLIHPTKTCRAPTSGACAERGDRATSKTDNHPPS